MLDVIQGAVQAGEEKNAQEALECFIEVCSPHLSVAKTIRL
jgi:hypothetical protein